MADSCSSVDKESACSAGDPVRSLGWEDPLEKEMATHSSILAGKISWTEEPGGLQSMGLQRVGHDWFTYLLIYLLTVDSRCCTAETNTLKSSIPQFKKYIKEKCISMLSIHLDLCSKTSLREQGKTKQNRILKRGLITFRSLDWISEESIKKLPQQQMRSL